LKEETEIEKGKRNQKQWCRKTKLNALV